MTVVEDLAGAVEGIVATEQARHPIPGVAIGILADDRVTTAAFGVTSIENPLPVTPDTLFQIGSITKTFLGTLVMHAVETGAVDLDTPVRRWVSGLRLRDEDAAARVTLRHLLTHNAGWFGDHFLETGWNDDALAQYVASMAEIEQQVPLGTQWAYNNAAFALAGRVIEVVSGLPVEQAMTDMLLRPLGLERTFFFPDEVITQRFVVGHNAFDDGPHVVQPWALPRNANCVGGITSTVGDLLAYARFHMGDGVTARGDRYLSAASMDLMRSPLVPAALGAHRGIAWSVEKAGDVTLIGHNGATFGQQALLAIAPAKRVAIAMLTNSGQAAQLQNAISRWWRQTYLGIEPKIPQARAFTTDEAQRVIGTYRQPANELRIRLDEGELILDQEPRESGWRRLMKEPPPIPKPVELSFSRPDRLLLLEGPLKDSEIEILGGGWIRFGGRLYRKVET